MKGPTRATTLPIDAKERKTFPVASGFMDYFPDAIVAIANLSHRGNEQHNPGKPLHWDRSKSTDEADTMLRHFLQRGTVDTDGIRHTVKLAWRALALLQKEIEAEGKEERDCEAIERWNAQARIQPTIQLPPTSGPSVPQADGDDGAEERRKRFLANWESKEGCTCSVCCEAREYQQSLISSTPVQVLNRDDRPVDSL